MYTFATLFSGGEGAGVGARNAGFRHLWGIEYVDEITEVAKLNGFNVLTRDILECDPKEFESPTLLHASPPCFPSGTTVLTDRGLKPIEKMVVGDMVVTHTGEFHAVTAVSSRKSNVVEIQGQGHWGMVCTPDHPFLSVQRTKTYPPSRERKPGNYVVTSVSNPGWVNAKELKGKHWLGLTKYPRMNIPEIEYRGNESLRGQNFEFTEEFFRLIGLWVGDGWTRYNDGIGHLKNRGTVYICSNKKECLGVENVLRDAGIRFNKREERTTMRFEINSRPLCRWLRDNFGKYAHGKKIPTWLLGLGDEAKRAFLEGYFLADGCVDRCPSFRCKRVVSSTVSKELAIGLRMIGLSLGYSVSIRRYSRNRDCKIERRSVNERDSYSMSFTVPQKSSIVLDMYHSGCVRKVTALDDIVDVYDITVENDESFIADGIIVHNCPSFSVAKRNKGETEQDLKLARKVCEFIEVLKPRWFTLENVMGYKKSESYKMIIKTLEGNGYFVDVQVLNSADFSVPQTRKRLIVRASQEGFLPMLPEKEKWVGWYQAIEDLIPTLPESSFAPWQLKRLPKELLDTITVDSAGYPDKEGVTVPVTRKTKDPVNTVVSNYERRKMRAFILNNQQSDDYKGGTYGVTARNDEEPTMTLSSSFVPKAVLIDSENAGRDATVINPDNPSPTVTAHIGRRPSNTPQALLVDSAGFDGKDGIKVPVQKTENEPAGTILSNLQRRDLRAFIAPGGNKWTPPATEDNPTYTITDSIANHPNRAAMNGRVVQMTPRALARFQSFPDSYILPEKKSLACRIIGNAVPPLMFQKIVELFVKEHTK